MKPYWPNGCRLGVILLLLILTATCAGQREQFEAKGDWLEAAGEDFSKWPGRVFEDSKTTFLRSDNIITLLLAGGASAAMHNSEADDNIEKNFSKHKVFNGFFDESINITGGPGFHFAATGLWYALSANSRDDVNKERAWTMMTALATTGLVTTGLKAVVNNESPNGKNLAWPSGHTSSSFTVAAVLDEFYGPKVGIPAYALATLVGLRMMDSGDHWASDVVFGAALGWVVGHSIAGKHKQIEIAGFKVLPYTAANSEAVIGINLLRQF